MICQFSLAQVTSSGVFKLMFYLTIVKKHDVTFTLGWQDSSVKGFMFSEKREYTCTTYLSDSGVGLNFEI